jgi:hypothetical protein
MMVTLNVISRDSSFNNGLVREVCSTTPISINTNSIISISPSLQDINEVDGRNASILSFTEVVYSMGSSVERLIVLGEYSKVVESMKDTRRLLNG